VVVVGTDFFLFLSSCLFLFCFFFFLFYFCLLPVPNDETTNWAVLARHSPMKRRKGEWSEHYDEESGCCWYHHRHTGQSTWEIPPENGTEDGTEEGEHGEDGEQGEQGWETYEWLPPPVQQPEHNKNEEQQWNHAKPPQPQALPQALPQAQPPPPSVSQHKEDSTTDWDLLSMKSPVKRRRDHWNQHLDHESGCYWYYNTMTEEHTVNHLC
jgi:hypothetical protein